MGQNYGHLCTYNINVRFTNIIVADTVNSKEVENMPAILITCKRVKRRNERVLQTP